MHAADPRVSPRDTAAEKYSPPPLARGTSPRRGRRAFDQLRNSAAGLFRAKRAPAILRSSIPEIRNLEDRCLQADRALLDRDFERSLTRGTWIDSCALAIDRDSERKVYLVNETVRIYIEHTERQRERERERDGHLRAELPLINNTGNVEGSDSRVGRNSARRQRRAPSDN